MQPVHWLEEVLTHYPFKFCFHKLQEKFTWGRKSNILEADITTFQSQDCHHYSWIKQPNPPEFKAGHSNLWGFRLGHLFQGCRLQTLLEFFLFMHVWEVSPKYFSQYTYIEYLHFHNKDSFLTLITLVNNLLFSPINEPFLTSSILIIKVAVIDPNTSS